MNANASPWALCREPRSVKAPAPTLDQEPLRSRRRTRRLAGLVTGLLASVLLAGPGNAAAQAPDSLALPDSTYLALTLELPVHASFQVLRLDSRSRTNAMASGNFYNYQLDRVEFVGCSMFMYHRAGRPAELGPLGDAARLEIPLKQIDLASLDARPGIGIWTDPPTWELFARSLNRKERPFVQSATRQTNSRGFNHFRIPLADRSQAHRFKALLADAARRCETWNTAPLTPRIGNP